MKQNYLTNLETAWIKKSTFTSMQFVTTLLTKKTIAIEQASTPMCFSSMKGLPTMALHCQNQPSLAGQNGELHRPILQELHEHGQILAFTRVLPSRSPKKTKAELMEICKGQRKGKRTLWWRQRQRWRKTAENGRERSLGLGRGRENHDVCKARAGCSALRRACDWRWERDTGQKSWASFSYIIDQLDLWFDFVQARPSQPTIIDVSIREKKLPPTLSPNWTGCLTLVWFGFDGFN